MFCRVLNEKIQSFSKNQYCKNYSVVNLKVTKQKIFLIAKFEMKWQQKRQFTANSNLAIYPTENVWEMFEQSRNKVKLHSNVESHLLIRVNFCSKVWSQFSNRATYHLETIGAAWLFVENLCLPKTQDFFIEKTRKAANFDEVHLHYICTILYVFNREYTVYNHLWVCPI